jgi:hypothetical protein
MLSEAKHLYATARFAFVQRFAVRSFATLRMTRFFLPSAPPDFASWTSAAARHVVAALRGPPAAAGAEVLATD